MKKKNLKKMSFVSGTYSLSSHENAKEFLVAMGAPDSYIQHVMGRPDAEQFGIEENEEAGTITLGVSGRQNTVKPGVMFKVRT